MSATNSTRSFQDVENNEGAYDEDSPTHDEESIEVEATEKLKKRYNGKDKERFSCVHTAMFHRMSSSFSILFAMGGMAASGYFTVANMLNQGVLSENGAGLSRSNPEAMTQAFGESSNEEQRAYLQALWYLQMFAVAFGVWVFAIMRSMGAIPQWVKVFAYATFIPMTVVFQWVVNTCDLYMYLDFVGSAGAVQSQTCVLRNIFQYAIWSCAGLSGISVLGAIVYQTKSNLCS
jgi:hypothetical protein